MKFTLPKAKYIWIVKITILLGIFLTTIFVYRPNIFNPVLHFDNLALEYAPDEWFQSPVTNYSFTPGIHTIRTNPSSEGFIYSQNNSIFYFNTTSGTDEPFPTDPYMDLLRFEFQEGNLLCGWGDDAYHFYEIDTKLKVKEIPTEGIFEAFGDSFFGKISFVSSDFEFLGFSSSDTFVLLHQSSNEGNWTQVYDVILPESYEYKTKTHHISENGTEIWEMGQFHAIDYRGQYLTKYVWNNSQFLPEDPFIFDTVSTDPVNPSVGQNYFLQFFTENDSLFAFKLTQHYYLTVNCSDFTARNGTLSLPEWLYDYGWRFPPRFHFAEGNDASMNVMLISENLTMFLALPVKPNAYITYSPAHSLSINGHLIDIDIAHKSDYVFIHEYFRAAEYLHEPDPMNLESVTQHFMYCYQISTASLLWWWADAHDWERGFIHMHRSSDQMIVEMPFPGSSSSASSTTMLLFDIPPIGTGEILLEPTFRNPYMNSWFLGVNFWSLAFFFLLRPKKKRTPNS